MRIYAISMLAFLTLFGCKTTEDIASSKGAGTVDAGTVGANPQPRYQVEYVSQFTPAGNDQLSVCTWNIQWIGHWKAKKNQDIANVLRNCDVAVIQEMVAPPWDVTVTSKGSQETVTLKGDVEAKAFVDAMKAVGFDGVELSAEDTGPTKNHTNTTASEWYIAFFKSAKVEIAQDLPKGFLARKLAGHSIYSRVPHAFGIRARHNGKPSVDMVLVSVHLHATGDNEPKRRCKARRIREFRYINQWITQKKKNHASHEKDYFVLGDMNIEDLEEVNAFMGESPEWLNTELAATEPLVDLDTPEDPSSFYMLRNVKSMNYAPETKTLKGTNIKRDKPYDHVMHYTTTTLDILPTLQIVDLAKSFDLESFPKANDFVQAYSDHNPLRFVVKLSEDRD